MVEFNQLWQGEIGVKQLRKFLRGIEKKIQWNPEEVEILEERDAVPLRIRIPGARGRSGPPAAGVRRQSIQAWFRFNLLIWKWRV